MHDDSLLPPGTPIDLDNCAREAIHVPGSIQPRGALLAYDEAQRVVVRASSNLVALTGVPADKALGRPLEEALGDAAAQVLLRHARAFGDLRERNPVELPDDGGQPLDAVLHRTGDLLVIEVEPASGMRPLAFANTYRAIQGALAGLQQAADLDALYALGVRAVRTLTGFDRVMVYRYDQDWNGEVVAEDKREDLNSFLGLHYPATDIPAQARALYEKNWLRLISDVDYEPSPVLGDGTPLDMTYAHLRSVSPIHVEYLQNMGVTASMSLSLMRGDRLWGLIACHHYSGPHEPPYNVRAAAEFLASALSVRLVAREDEQQARADLEAQRSVSQLLGRALDSRVPVVEALCGADGGSVLRDLVGADTVLVALDGTLNMLGEPLPSSTTRALLGFVDAHVDDVVVSECLSKDAPELEVPPAEVGGLLATRFPDGRSIVWLRRETVRSVDWGGDPRNKAIAAQQADGTVRIGPRQSFDRWREVVSGCCRSWSPGDRMIAGQLRSQLTDVLLARSSREAEVGRLLQQSFLPTELPRPAGWELDARYLPASGQVGGDWYDALRVGPDRLALVLGDVAGHGVPAAGDMAQLRDFLRVILRDGVGPAAALSRLDALAADLLPDAMATVLVATLDVRAGEVVVASAGHPPPLLVPVGGAPRFVDVDPRPPIGTPFTVSARETAVHLARGATLLAYSDGLVERRGEALEVGLSRLLDQPVGLSGPLLLDALYASRDPAADDDATALAVRRLTT